MESRPYLGHVAAMATKHGKVPLVGPALCDVLGLLVVQAEVDTDLLGTFTGEVPRTDAPAATAFRKARLGMEATGRQIGIASEGTIGPDGLLPVVADLEVVAIVDDVHGFSLAETAVGYGTVAHSWVLDGASPHDHDLHRAGFPSHGLIVRRDDDPTGTIHKGIRDERALYRAIAECRSRGAGAIRVDSDLRAMHSPTRCTVIERAARALAERLAVACPRCACPGWGLVEVVAGRPCAGCSAPTRLVVAHIEGCPRCDARRTVESAERTADPSTCGLCNP